MSKFPKSLKIDDEYITDESQIVTALNSLFATLVAILVITFHNIISYIFTRPR